MSELRSVLDQMTAVADEDLTVEELATEIAELSHVGLLLQPFPGLPLVDAGLDGQTHALAFGDHRPIQAEPVSDVDRVRGGAQGRCEDSIHKLLDGG